MITHIRGGEARRTETPNGVMTTLVSPTQGRTSTVAWRVEMRAGQGNPDHTVDVDQIWTWLSGSATVRLPGDELIVESGDTVIIPAGPVRRVETETGFEAIVVASAGGRVTRFPDGDPMTPPWMA